MEMEMEGETGGESEKRNYQEIDRMVVGHGGYNKDVPPVDDVCPICLDRFTVPCRSNCGHWFCGSCILQFCMFRSSIQPCKCPLCCFQIINLKPETSQPMCPADDLADTLKKVQQYNGFHGSGLLGSFQRILALPLFMGPIFRGLIDPDGLRCMYYGLRLLGLSLALLYEKGEFEFVATGGLGIQRTFAMCASLLFVTLFFVGIVYRWVLRNRARHLATQQPSDGWVIGLDDIVTLLSVLSVIVFVPL